MLRKSHSSGETCPLARRSYRAPEEKGGLRAYMDDSPANRGNFMATTILSTGPGQVTNNIELLMQLWGKCGIVGKGSPLMTIP